MTMEAVHREPLRFIPIPTREFAADVLREVADRYGLTLAQITGVNRQRKYAWPRQHAYWEIKRRCPHADLSMIGRVVGRDRTSILHGIRAHEKRMAEGKA